MSEKFVKFKPEIGLRNKSIIFVLLGILIVWIPFALTFWFASRLILWIGSLVFLIVTLLGLWISIKYFRTIEFEILADEVHVNRGLITRSRKIVPYRTITNIEIKQGPFDRLFGIGTIWIQTAGSSAPARGPEEVLDGIQRDQLDIIQQLLVNNVRQIRGSPGTSQDVEPLMTNTSATADVSELILELQAIKSIMIEIRDK